MSERGTKITIRLRPDQLSKLLATIKTADPEGRTTPGAFVKQAALTYCDQFSSAPFACGPDADDPAETDDDPPAPEDSPNIRENALLPPEESQPHSTGGASPDPASPAPPERQPASEAAVGPPPTPQPSPASEGTAPWAHPSPTLSSEENTNSTSQSAGADVPENPHTQDSGSNAGDPLNLLDFLPFRSHSSPGDGPNPGISPDRAETFEDFRQILVAELDQVRRFFACLYVQANDIMYFSHRSIRNAIREDIEALEVAEQRVKECVSGLTTGFLTAQEQAVKLLEQADHRYSLEVKRRMENLDQIPQQIRKSSDEILAAFKKHAGETSETLTRVSTASLRVAEKLQAQNLRVGFKTFLAAILTSTVIGLPAFGWLAWQNSQLRTRADTWRESAERINRYVVETLYPHMNEKERVEANNFYARHRLPTPEDQTRARAK